MIRTDGTPTICSPEVDLRGLDALREDNVRFLDTDKVQATEEAERIDALRVAFLAGWDVTGEGYNAEYVNTRTVPANHLEEAFQAFLATLRAA